MVCEWAVGPSGQAVKTGITKGGVFLMACGKADTRKLALSEVQEVHRLGACGSCQGRSLMRVRFATSAEIFL